MFLALKEIKKEKLRFLMIILVTALIAYLIYFLSSLAYELAQLNRTAVDHWQSKGIILNEASNMNIYASSINEAEVEEFDLSNSININTASIQTNDESELVDVVFLGVENDNDSIIAPIVEGRIYENEHEMVISNNIRNEYDLKINDEITVSTNNRVFKVVGFTEDSNYNTLPVAYVEREMASQAMMIYSTDDPEVDAVATPTPNMPTRVAGIVIYDEVDVSVLKDKNLLFVPIETFINSIPGYMAQVLTFGLMIGALAIISSIIIGIFMYILTMQKKPIFGILKIQGYRNRMITTSVIYQTLILITIGFIIGLIATLITIYFMPASVPIMVSPLMFVVVTVVSIVCSLIGSLFSVRTILKIDPLDAI